MDGADRVKAALAEFQAATTPYLVNGWRVWRSPGWSDGPIVILHLTAEEGALGLATIMTPSGDRRLGYGGQALAYICALADRHHIPIVGAIEPFGWPSKALSYRELVDWYRRRGFVVDRATMTMRREPRGPA